MPLGSDSESAFVPDADEARPDSDYDPDVNPAETGAWNGVVDSNGESGEGSESYLSESEGE